MDLSVGASRQRRRFACSLPLYRWGDLALCQIWAVFAAVALAQALGEAQDARWLAAAHTGTIALVFGLYAMLFVLRRPAVARGEGWKPKLIALLGSFTMPVAALFPLTWTPDWLLAATTIGMIAANACVVWSLLTLRRSFSVFPEARALVRHGPYGVVRHPLYATYIATQVLVVLPRFGPAVLAVSAVGIACEVWRARTEERVLRATFPDYAEYAAVTPRFIPRLLGRRHPAPAPR